MSEVARRVRIVPDEFMHTKPRAGEEPFNVLCGFSVTPLQSEMPLARTGSDDKAFSDAQVKLWIAQIEIAKEESIERANRLVRTLESLL